MNSAVAPSATPSAGADALYPHLDALENESIYILRETFRHFKKSAMLWSIGKDSCVMLWLARKAFLGHVPFPCVHVDTSYKIPEMIEFRDRLAREWNLNLIVGQNTEALAAGRTFPNGVLDRVGCCTALKRDPLAAVIADRNSTRRSSSASGATRKARAPRSGISPRATRTSNGISVTNRRSSGAMFQTDFEPGTHLRVHPLLHWTELNVWEYIHRENIPLVSLYYARNGRRYRSLWLRAVYGHGGIQRHHDRRDHRRASPNQDRRAQHPRAGSGERGCV